MTVTLNDLKKSHIKETAHFTGQGFFGYIMTNVEYPRLTRYDKYTKKDRSVVSTWRVDGEPVEGLEGAVEKLNIPPNLTLDEKAALDLIPVEFENLREVEKRVGNGDKDEGMRLVRRLSVLGQLEYGRAPGRSDGEPWHDSVPKHLRFSPTIRRVMEP